MDGPQQGARVGFVPLGRFETGQFHVTKQVIVVAKWMTTMNHANQTRPRFAVSINNTEDPASLERHKIYRVLPDEEAARDGDIRVIDESGEDYLYPAAYFVVIDVPQEVEHAILHAS